MRRSNPDDVDKTIKEISDNGDKFDLCLYFTDT